METAYLAGLSVLIVDDEVLLRKAMAAGLERLGADVVVVGNLAAARQMTRELSLDLVLLDVHLPDGLGTELLKEKAFQDGTSVIVMTAHGAVAGAVEAMRLGASDYLVKPVDAGELPLVVHRVIRARQSARAREHQRADDLQSGQAFFFGSALAALQQQLEKILAADRRVAGPLAPVLIEGETGTGKTTIARWLHHQGPRAEQPLVEVNCSALPETLAESELFGHERGAFTDARSAKMGLFEAASGGTLFLDELPSLSPALQVKVLMAIEDQRIRRVGGNKPIAVDARVVAATNCDLAREVAEGRFRQDLYHRLDLFRVRIPPLRERGEEIVAMAEMLLRHLCRRHRMPPKRISDKGRHRLRAHRWPGNVRELLHELERAVVFSEREEIDFDQLPDVAGTGEHDPADWFNDKYVYPEQGFDLEAAICRLVHHALKQTGQNVSAAARLLGVTRDYLRYRLAEDKGADERGHPG